MPFYGKIWVRENPYSGTFYVVLRQGKIGWTEKMSIHNHMNQQVCNEISPEIK